MIIVYDVMYSMSVLTMKLRHAFNLCHIFLPPHTALCHRAFPVRPGPHMCAGHSWDCFWSAVMALLLHRTASISLWPSAVFSFEGFHGYLRNPTMESHCYYMIFSLAADILKREGGVWYSSLPCSLEWIKRQLGGHFQCSSLVRGGDKWLKV